MLPQVKDLVTKHQPELIWADGDWEANSTFWKSPEFLAWLYNESPVKDTVIVNDRWGSDCSLKHGGYYSGGDRFTPGKLLAHVGTLACSPTSGPPAQLTPSHTHVQTFLFCLSPAEMGGCIYN